MPNGCGLRGHAAARYVDLNVELARFRLMRIVQKQEDWNLFYFPRAEKFTQYFNEAARFTDYPDGLLDHLRGTPADEPHPSTVTRITPPAP